MKVKGTKNKNLAPKKYLDMITRPYLSAVINDHKFPKNQEFIQVIK